MPKVRIRFLVALALSLPFHAGLLALWTFKVLPPSHHSSISSEPLRISIETAVNLKHPAKTLSKLSTPTPPDAKEKEHARTLDSIPSPAAPEKKLASMPAPPPPTQEEWKLAATYTLRNSKRYRYNWGQLVRSMMGTAVEGPDQGQVRFRIEIAPDGKIAKVETLWTTSQQAEKLALKAIQSLPPLPPTPTGKSLVFEQTISFEPFATGWAPSYKLDCLPEPQPFHNPFAWDGSSPQQASQEHQGRSHRPPPPADCIYDSTADSIEEEDADMKRQLDQWRWGR